MPNQFKVHQPAHRVTSAQRDAEYDARRYSDPLLGAAARLRNSLRWQRLRKSHRQAHPICFDPYRQHEVPAPAEHVHHAIPLVRCITAGLIPANLFSLCTMCHGRVERRARLDPVGAVRLFLTMEQELEIRHHASPDRHQHPELTLESTKTSLLPEPVRPEDELDPNVPRVVTKVIQGDGGI